MSSIILTCNAGSSNIKLAAYDAESLERFDHAKTFNSAETLSWLKIAGEAKVAAIGHRVVHGGSEFSGPVQITDQVMERLKRYITLAPLHQPAALSLIEEVTKLYPEVLQIACFDTAFHHTMPDMARRLPLPRWFHKEGIQRYGFHGLSYEYIASILPEHLGEKANGRVIVAHLGNGSSICAMKERKSIATTMGFTALDGLMMGTRCGSIDPGVVLHLLKEMEMTLEEVTQLLYLESGLQGVSGVSSDIRDVLASNAPTAKEAIELYCYLAAKQLGGLLPALGGLDALIFTGGIGEHCEEVRKRIVSYLQWLPKFTTLTLPTNEERILAQASYNAIRKEMHAA